MRVNHWSLAGSPAGTTAAGAPAASADSATRNIGASVAGIVNVVFCPTLEGEAGCPANVAGDPAATVVLVIIAVMRFSSSRYLN
eukprot:6892569-Pyramimonas_sp.AAC.1